MSGATALGVPHYLGLVAGVGLVAAAMWVLWTARHRGAAERAVLPIVGKVGNPTCLTIGLVLLVSGYHAVCYALQPVVTLVSIPMDRWWLLVLIGGIAVGGSLLADRLESGDPDG